MQYLFIEGMVTDYKQPDVFYLIILSRHTSKVTAVLQLLFYNSCYLSEMLIAHNLYNYYMTL